MMPENICITYDIFWLQGDENSQEELTFIEAETQTLESIPHMTCQIQQRCTGGRVTYYDRCCDTVGGTP